MLSAVYMAGFIGAVAAFFWAMFSIGWWGGLPILAMYGLTFLIPSAISDTKHNPVVAHLEAISEATEELKVLPQGKEKTDRIMQRADEIMRSRGWKPKATSEPTSD
jgi:hypothetical protein